MGVLVFAGRVTRRPAKTAFFKHTIPDTTKRFLLARILLSILRPVGRVRLRTETPRRLRPVGQGRQDIRPSMVVAPGETPAPSGPPSAVTPARLDRPRPETVTVTDAEEVGVEHL